MMVGNSESQFYALAVVLNELISSFQISSSKQFSLKKDIFHWEN